MLSCVSLRLSHWETYAKILEEPTADPVAPGEKPPWSLEGFLERLIKWIVATDQVCCSRFDFLAADFLSA